MKLTLLVLTVLALGLGGCVPSTPQTPEEIAAKKTEEAKVAAARTQRLKDMASACNRNDGIKDVESLYNGGKYRYKVADVVTCNDGMSKEFPL